jgi:hypothetical protein
MSSSQTLGRAFSHGHLIIPNLERQPSEVRMPDRRTILKKQHLLEPTKSLGIRSFGKNPSSLTIFSQTCCSALNPAKLPS